MPRVNPSQEPLTLEEIAAQELENNDGDVARRPIGRPINQCIHGRRVAFPHQTAATRLR